MSFWFILWLVISVLLTGFLIWTIVILVKQKAVWKAYANKHKLRYKPHTFFSPPEMNGVIDTHSVHLFPGEHATPDARYSRKMTAVEIQLANKMPVEGGVASDGMVDLIQGLSFKEEYKPEHKLWQKSYIASAESKAVLEAYFSKERLDALLKLMKVENFWVIFIFRGDVTLLRLDTSDPLNSQEKLDKVVKTMVKTAQILEFKDGEEDRLKQVLKKKPVAKAVSIDVDDEIEDTGLKLEEDESDQAEPEEKPSTEKE